VVRDGGIGVLWLGMEDAFEAAEAKTVRGFHCAYGTWGGE
jgi:hypothetical protein